MPNMNPIEAIGAVVESVASGRGLDGVPDGVVGSVLNAAQTVLGAGSLQSLGQMLFGVDPASGLAFIIWFGAQNYPAGSNNGLGGKGPGVSLNSMVASGLNPGLTGPLKRASICVCKGTWICVSFSPH